MNPSYYVSAEALHAISEATGANFAPSSRGGGMLNEGEEGSEEDGEDVGSEEEINEEEELEEVLPRFNNRLANGAVKFL